MTVSFYVSYKGEDQYLKCQMIEVHDSFKVINPARVFLRQIMDTMDEKDSVVTCYRSIGIGEDDNKRDGQKSILMSHNWDDVINFLSPMLEYDRNKNPVIVLQQHNNYQQALDLLKCLKRGF